LISHADWSKNPDKRWLSVAVMQPNHRWLVCELSKVSELSSLFLQNRSHLPELGCILSGFDFSIGVPSNYAAKAGITGFLATLPIFGQEEWDHLYIPVELPSEISIQRPFYPNRPGRSRC